MEILYVLLVLLIATRAFGEVAVRMGQPALVGELLAGVALGMIVVENGATFPILAELPENPVFAAVTDLGIFFLMLMAGLELRPKKLAEASGRSVVIAVGEDLGGREPTAGAVDAFTHLGHEHRRVGPAGQLRQLRPQVLLQGSTRQSCPGRELVTDLVGHVADRDRSHACIVHA